MIGRMKPINCSDCKQHFSPRRPNAKYCDYCRLARNLKYWMTRSTECWLCEKKFVPVDRDNSNICSSCQPAHTAAIHDVACHNCNEARKLIHPEIRWCYPCAENPTSRRGLVKAVFRKQAERMVQSPDAA